MRQWGIRRTRRDLFKFACAVKNATCLKFDLCPKSFGLFHLANPARKKYWGSCSDAGHIKIDVFHDEQKRFATEEEVIDTVIHELAHLRYYKHNNNFHRFFKQMLTWFRRIYG